MVELTAFPEPYSATPILAAPGEPDALLAARVLAEALMHGADIIEIATRCRSHPDRATLAEVQLLAAVNYAMEAD